MNRELAVQIIGAANAKMIEESWEGYFFKLKQTVLNTPSDIRILKIREKKTVQAVGIYDALFNTSISAKPSVIRFPDDVIGKIFEWVEREVSISKLKVSNSNMPHEMLEAVRNWMTALSHYESWLLKLGGALGVQPIEAGKSIDPYVLKLELKTVMDKLLELKLTNISQYDVPVDQFPIFANELARIQSQNSTLEN